MPRSASAWLSGTLLVKTNLTDAYLGGANLATAKNLTQQLDLARGDDQTELPIELPRSAHWSAESTAPPPADR